MMHQAFPLCRRLLLAAAALGLVACHDEAPAEKTYSQRMVESHGLGDFYCNRHYQDSLSHTGWDYVSGLVAGAVLQAWMQYPEQSAYYDAVKAFADFSLDETGTQIRNTKGGEALRPSNIDDLPAGNIYFELHREELRRGNAVDAQRYRSAATVIRNRLKFNHSRIAEGLPGAGGFFHKAVYPNQMWLDGLFMGSPVYARWQHCFGAADDTGSWDDIALQFKTIHRYTYDADKQLNYHAWSATPEAPDSFWAQRDGDHRGCSREFWARGMGWYFAALVDVLEVMPAAHPDYAALKEILSQVAAGLARRQDAASGVWYQLLQYDGTVCGDGTGDRVGDATYNVGTTANYLEASASCIFTYAYLKGIRLGLLDRATYLPLAERAYEGLLKTFIRERADGGLDIVQSCASAGLGPAKSPSRTGTVNYYLCGSDVGLAENEGKAVGCFILASLEYERR